MSPPPDRIIIGALAASTSYHPLHSKRISQSLEPLLGRFLLYLEAIPTTTFWTWTMNTPYMCSIWKPISLPNRLTIRHLLGCCDWAWPSWVLQHFAAVPASYLGARFFGPLSDVGFWHFVITSTHYNIFTRCLTKDDSRTSRSIITLLPPPLGERI